MSLRMGLFLGIWVVACATLGVFYQVAGQDAVYQAAYDFGRLLGRLVTGRL